MGNPIKHSKSPWIHAQFAKQFNLAVSYIKVKPDFDKFAVVLENFINMQGNGINVTLPFKEEAYKLATQTSLRASIAKAVNTIKITVDRDIYGDNTDGCGIINDLTINLNYSLTGKTVLIIGAGGAVRGILQPILAESPAQLIIANRTIVKAQQLATEFRVYGNIYSCGLNDLKDYKVDVIINAIAVNTPLYIPESLMLTNNSLCYDLNYNNTRTPFIKWAQEKNCKIITNGLGMLIEQAAESFFLWTGKRVDVQSVIYLANKLVYKKI